MDTKNTQFAVLGLGRFGTSIVRTLCNYDVNVLACDNDPARVHAVADCATVALQADVTDESAMAQLGLGNFDVVILAMAEDFESSVIATLMAKEYGAKYVIVKAYGLRQKKILESIGADKVVLPETEMGARLAQQLAHPNVLDILDDSDRYTISEMYPLSEWVGKSVRDSNIRTKHRMMILAIRRGDMMIIPVSPREILLETDILITLSEHDALVT